MLTDTLTPMPPARIAAIRRQLGLTRNELARALAMTGANARETVKRWETGEAAITGPASVALRAMALFGAPDDWRELAREPGGG